MSEEHSFDVIVIGSGAAGLDVALQLDAAGVEVAVLSKTELEETNTWHAQGGIAAVLDDADSFEAHIRDTLIAGAGLCDEEVVRFVVEHAPAAIARLERYGARFTRADDGQYHLTREGGHSARRIVHAADATGREMEESMAAKARRAPHITIFEQHMAVDLIREHVPGKGYGRIVGVYVLNRNSGRVDLFRARAIVLATGGASKVYLYTTNPDITTGDGIAMAWRAGCRVANMEFEQFHPTCLYHPQAKAQLISEAVRGEGGRLLLPNGERFMPRFDERAELAPRDIVARAIDHEMKRLGIDHVYLDISHKPADFIRSHFPNIYAALLKFGIDMTREPIPVVPAAHYTCGGVMVDMRARTDIENLYAVGEVTYTGLHGANRMASNSLLECLVYAEAAVHDLLARLEDIPPPPPLPAWDESRVTDSDEMVVVSHNWDEIRRFMWDYVGIVRTTKRLQRARNRITLLQQEIAEYYGGFRVTSDLLELRNLALVAELIITSALRRKESRGLHYTLDYPEPRESQRHPTILVPDRFWGCEFMLEGHLS
ncbi:L-aspartate oxidase [Thermopetrobacter sp. TC1]|uniref:L-aspartate oxidase n=1 Tax=Thermopetrobacter sp. TC1 TaxID=1495045 RepID=UPI00068B45B5|nr:L-aspartate oxidase [Thermopetrobacter sp. TC1]